ncbi:hypothetical protein OIU84_021687 [Salix udensis]|uniref:ABC transmembrane type-1 domain-containing protein n=1 Tax=Salix udensis TaxID=889485 RepID=A0AAD6PJ99_9ROSI|nr:hypothetical protein OIU84_021687 [Salix udensis]
MGIFELGTGMEISVEIVYAAFAILLVAWLLIDIFKRRRGGGDLRCRELEAVKQSTVLFTAFTVLSNVIISILYLGFGFYEYWELRIITSKSVSLSMTWILATLVACYSKNISHRKDNRSIELPYPWPEANIADFASLPLSVLLCFNAVTFSRSTKTHVDNETPLLQEKHEIVGRIEKLELSHVPSVPASETAKYASSLLEDSFGKNKNETLNLPKAIAYAVWKSLTINGVFAGYLQGLVLAFIFFFSKTVESLTQRQWYFGAQRIGIRVRAALSVLVYKKSLSVKFARSSNGKIINLINVDVERIGDFCWNIHGVWLLPFQVFLALVILYRNLGAAPSIAALSSTILVMVSNTPLASKQERLHSRIMEAKDSRIRATSETLKSMRVLKLYSWEPTFLKKLLQLRETERNWLRKYLYTSSAITFLFWASPTLVSVVTFGVCVLLKKPFNNRGSPLRSCNIPNSARAHLQPARAFIHDCSN